MNAPLETNVLPYVVRDTRDGTATLTLNRGERYNPLSQAMIAALQAELDSLAIDTSVRSVVLAASGKGFCAGHDLKELRAHPDLAWQRKLFADCETLMLTLTRLPQPVIARVHGLATAAGCQLVSMCDLAVAADTARFALPGECRRVLHDPAVGVARNIAQATMEMLLTGSPSTPRPRWRGDWSTACGLAELDAAIGQFTRLTDPRSARLIGRGKQAFYRQVDLGLEAAYREVGETMACSLLDPHAHEGIDAFIEKRTPHWDE